MSSISSSSSSSHIILRPRAFECIGQAAADGSSCRFLLLVSRRLTSGSDIDRCIQIGAIYRGPFYRRIAFRRAPTFYFRFACACVLLRAAAAAACRVCRLCEAP